MIRWIGPIVKVRNAQNSVVHVQVEARDGERGLQNIVTADIGVWPMLLLGSRWRNGARVAVTQENTYRANVEVTGHSKVHFARAYDRLNGIYIIRPTEYRIDPFGKDSHLLIVRREIRDELGDLIVPCTELFRSYFGRDSKLASMILTGRIHGGQKLYDEHRTLIEDDGRAFIVLGKEIRNALAPLIAFVAFDDAANEALSNIVRDTAAAHEGDGYHVAMRFPVSARSVWTIEGTPVGTASEPRFLVTRLERWTADLPFSKLETYRENIGGRPSRPNAPQTAFAGVVKQARPAPGHDILVTAGVDASIEELPFPWVDDEISTWFPELKHIALQNPQPETRSGSQLIESRTPAISFSGSPGTSTGRGSSIEFRPGDGLGNGRPGDLDYFLQTLEEMPSIAEDFGVALDVTHEVLRLEWSEREHVAWSRLRSRMGEERARRVVVARLVVESQAITLFEIERRPKPVETTQETLALLGVYGDPEPEVLDDIFYCCARSGGKFSGDLWRQLNLSQFARIRILHNVRNTPKDFARRILVQIARHGSVQDSAQAEAQNEDSEVA